jgi:hypothetical protein
MKNFDNNKDNNIPKSLVGFYMSRIKNNFEKSMEQMVPENLVSIARFVNPF